MAESEGNTRMGVWIVAWSVCTALLLWLIASFTELPWGITVFMVLLPLVLGALASLVRRRRVTAAHGEYEIETQAARSEASLLVPASPEAVREAVRHAATGQFQLVGEQAGKLALQRRMNLATWGMTLRVTVTSTAEGTRIHAFEEPRLGTTIFDWGQGRRDIVHLFERIEEHLTGPALEA